VTRIFFAALTSDNAADQPGKIAAARRFPQRSPGQTNIVRRLSGKNRRRNDVQTGQFRTPNRTPQGRVAKTGEKASKKGVALMPLPPVFADYYVS
jgi:hypothetical protein